jgi:predicted DNA-binding protein YlxM (UPF0122 family)
MNYTVDETATKLNVSKQAIYNKIKLDEFKNKITKKHGKTYIDDAIVTLIKDSLKLNVNYKDALNPKDIEEDTLVKAPESTKLNFNKEVAADTDYIDYLKSDIAYLKEQLNEQSISKDLQISNLNERLKQEQELNKNSQILQLRQPQNIKQLEEHFNDLDDKLEEVRNKMSDRKEKQEHKSFFNKIFKGND